MTSFPLDTRRNVIKADLGLAKKGQFPMALVENAHRFVQPKLDAREFSVRFQEHDGEIE
jgi:hypothetical protein